MTTVGTLVGSVVGSLVGSEAGVVAVPAGFTWTPPFTLSAGPGRGYTATVNTESLKPATSQTLYVSPLGSNANAGTAPGAAAKATVEGALLVVGSKTIRVQGGTYHNWGDSSIAYDTVIVAHGDGAVTLSSAPDPASLVWASAGSGAYSTTVAEPFGVADYADADIYRLARWLVPQASVAAVQASGGWFWSLGTLTIKTSDARAPDGLIRCPPLATNGFVINGAALNVYIEGIRTFGAFHTLYAVATGIGQLALVDCKFHHPRAVGVRVDVATTAVYVIRTEACGAYGSTAGFADGGNYTLCNVLEVDCLMVQNGVAGNPSAGLSCNGSSGHAGAKIVRCGGIYGGSRSVGPALAEVSGGMSLNLGVRCVPVLGGSDPANQLASTFINGVGSQWFAGSLLEQNAVVVSTAFFRDTGAVVTGGGTAGTW